MSIKELETIIKNASARIGQSDQYNELLTKCKSLFPKQHSVAPLQLALQGFNYYYYYFDFFFFLKCI